MDLTAAHAYHASMPTAKETNERQDRFGLDGTASSIAVALGKLVPESIARRSLSISVSTDKERYKVDEPVELTVEIANHLPVPVTVETPTRRLWGWTVDGELEASDERIYVGDDAGAITFGAKERKRIVHRWNGRLKRVGDDATPTQWVEPDRGAHEIGAFLAVEGDRPTDSTEIRIE
jgi:hypothetical protein